jgi:ABC-2 type transport system permease protein
MRKIWLVIKREYLTRVRTKGFIIWTIALPLFTIGVVILPVLMATRQANRTQQIAILDQTGALAARIAEGLDEKLPNGQAAYHVVRTVEPPAAAELSGLRQELRAQVNAGKLDGYLIVSQGVLAGSPGRPAEYYSKNPTADLTSLGTIRRAVSDAVIAWRLKQRGFQAEKLSDLVRGVEVTFIKVTREGEVEEKGQTFFTAFIMAFVLYMTLIIYGVITMRSVMEEKNTRIVEVLVSSLRPFQLLMGKILGVAAVGFTQYLIWTVCGGLLAGYGAAMAAAVNPGVSLPKIQLPVSMLVYLVVFYLAGYFLYASLYAAAGAMVSSDEEAQQVQIPMTLMIVVSLMLFMVIMRNPNSTLSVVLSLIPFFAPILMILRIAVQTPPFWQIAASIGLTLVTTLGLVKFSAKIYRVGILMYGKRPSLVELLRWLRYT